MATQYTAGLSSGQVLTAATMNSIGAAWENWSPTFAPTAGAFTTVTVNTAKYSQIGKLVTCRVYVSVSNVGTGSGQMTMTLPMTAAAGADGAAVGVWRERQTTGDMGFIYKNTQTSFQWVKYDQSAFLGSSRSYAGTFTYEAA
jgi:hypothetical protein